jgi:hypothetical protein
MNYLKKINIFLKSDGSEELKPPVVSRLDIQYLLETIIYESDDKLEQMVGLMKIIDRVFHGSTKKYFYF